MTNRLTIERAEYDVFRKKFKAGGFGAQRLGQAFYNHFHLHKMKKLPNIESVYELSDAGAEEFFERYIEFS